MTQTIPLRPRAHIRLRTDLDGERIELLINWLTRFEYFTVDILQNGRPVALGRGLHPDTDLLQSTTLESVGTLKLQGLTPTPDNLGVDNQLEFTEAT